MKCWIDSIPNLRSPKTTNGRAAFFEKKDSDKRMLIKNRCPMSILSAGAITLLYLNKMIRTGGIIRMRLCRLLIKKKQYTKLVPTVRFDPPSSNLDLYIFLIYE